MLQHMMEEHTNFCDTASLKVGLSGNRKYF